LENNTLRVAEKWRAQRPANFRLDTVCMTPRA
jgi:hypothetical protein